LTETEDELFFGLPQMLCCQGGEGEVLEIHKTFEQNQLLIIASTILQTI